MAPGGDDASDLRLPDPVVGPPRLLALVQAHLLRLGDPDPAARPSTDEAPGTGEQLRDLAVSPE